MLQLPPQVTREKGGGFDEPTYPISNKAGSPLVPISPASVEEVMLITVIASEELITALSGEHHFDLLCGEARHEIERNAGGPRNRFILVPDQPGQGVEKVIRVDDHFVVIRANRL